MVNQTVFNLNEKDQAEFLDPEKILNTLGFELGSQVADFGCGAGFFSLTAAKKIGSEGVVYSLDILKEKLEAVDSQAKRLGLTNISTKRVNFEKAGGSGLENDLLDWVIIKTVLFQNKDKSAILSEAFRVTKKGGKALIIDWKINSSVGPEKSLRISREAVLEIARKNGWNPVGDIEVGDFHFGLIFEKPNE